MLKGLRWPEESLGNGFRSNKIRLDLDDHVTD